MSLPLNTAERFAIKIKSELSPFCDRIEIAGSIRRRRPVVNDIDLVVLPKAGREAALRERCTRNARRVQVDGSVTLIVYLPYPPAGPEGLQLDIWIANQPTRDLFGGTPTNFGSLLLMRTGSREHNIHLICVAEKLGLKWNPYHGVFSGRQCVARETEEDIFRALGLAFVPPERREI